MSTGIIGIDFGGGNVNLAKPFDQRKRRVIVEHSLMHPIEHTIAQALRDLRFGSVEIIVHDSKVIQIEQGKNAR
jgi:hypothetical protein